MAATKRRDKKVDKAYNVDEDDEEIGVEEAAKEQQAWEKSYANDRTWEDIQEDESGRLHPLAVTQQQREHRRQQMGLGLGSGGTAMPVTARIRRGIIRYLVLALDFSKSAGDSDYRPSRLACLSSAAQRFIRLFFDANPLSHLAVVVLREGVARQVTDLTASPDSHVAAVRANMTAAGQASLQNTIETSLDLLGPVPSYGHRELLLLFSSLSSCDPSDLLAGMRRAAAASLRCSVVGMAAEIHVCRQLADMTGGRYDVALSEGHFNSLVTSHASPPPIPPGRLSSSLVRMAFPPRTSDTTPALCSCHLQLKLGGTFVCPRCKARMCGLPSDCRVCGTTLVSSPHLARSYHHLFPIPPFKEVPLSPSHAPPRSLTVNQSRTQQQSQNGCTKPLPANCFSCLSALPMTDSEEGGMRLQCEQCGNHFCFDCDTFIHESLHNCPGCECRPPSLTTT